MLYVKELLVNEGPRLKRMWPRGRGRADRLQKRMCHISVVRRRDRAARGRGARMGQKVNPYGLRLGINKTWKSRWFVDPREYAKTLHEDLRAAQGSSRAARRPRARTSPTWRSSAIPSA